MDVLSLSVSSSAAFSNDNLRIPPLSKSAAAGGGLRLRLAAAAAAGIGNAGKALKPESRLIVKEKSVSVILLAGGQGKRMGVLKDGCLNGAAVLGVPVKATIKEVIKTQLLKEGFELVNREGLEVTDDVSIVEHLQHPVYITEGSYTNIKVTTPDDLLLAERMLSMSSGKSSE
ncbi:hypothetical protein C1H46_018387 [Malus baccata]|uniref:2-C-methyl-D-erythritol 4-phosphate cytidylyltransferase n=1 Tax=Malus baccata TaxID=106549 RepID=A0A540MBC8_MALBA|nr:hypothetical protein C1H46_018387 [Malus baccata]